MELSPLIKKIGHSLAEIRVRALKSIICKLDHSLLSVSDLVQEKMLFVYLLEWFNFPEVPMQEEVLQLISTLSKHPTAAQMLRDVGAVEFLTQLSPNVEPPLRAIIDGIFDLLFQLPELLPACPTIYSNIHQLQNTATAVPLEEDSPAVGYFQTKRPSHIDVPPQRIAVNNSVGCLKFSTFPWLALTTTDQHILSSNESSLRSNNHNLVRTTCELLRDVIMQDFPAEIFLQRPSIVQNLLSILRLTPGESEAGYLRLQAVACLQQLCVGLRKRLRFHRDPSFYSAKEDPVSQNSSLSYSQEVHGGGGQRSLASSPGGECFPRPSVVGRNGQRPRGDGQDGDAASNSSSSSQRGGAAAQASRQTAPSPADAAQLELPDLGVEDVLVLQLQQLSLAQFTVATMEHAIPLLRTDGVRVFRGVCELLCEAVVLLRDGVCDLVWDDTSLVGMELREKLKITMETLGDIMTYHESCSSDCPESSMVQHRLAYVATAVFTIRLLQTILPLEKASGHLPESAVAVLLSLCLDRPFSLAYPSMAEAAVAYLEQVNPEGHDLYRRTSRAALWMESTCMFLKETQQQGDKNWLELLELADQAIDGLPYHQHLPIVKECIHICSYLWKFEQASPLLQTESQRVLLKLLTHPLLPVKTETYTCTLNVVKECLGVQNVVKPVSSVCSGVHFLLHPKVLYQISAFGLQDPIGKVNSAAKDILLFLLKCPLMMTASTWDRFNQALYPVIPILQSYAGTEDALGNCVLLISEVSNEVRDGVFPNTAKLRAALRLLFTKEPEVRAAAVQHLLPHLTSVEGATTVRPTLEGPVLSSLPSLFCLNNALDINLDSSDRSFLKVESVEKLFSIFTSDTVDLTLRRSAAEQLAVVLQETAMHPVLKSLGVTDKVICFITESVNDHRKSMDCLLEPCVCILRKLVYADPSLRHLLAEKTPLLITLLRASLLVKENKGDVSEAAVLMCLLLFDEIATVEVWSDNSSSDVALSPFSLPVSVIRRYSLPFQAASHHAVSPYCSVLPPYSDLLSLTHAKETLQLAWNTAWHSGIDNLLEELRGIRSDVADFHGDLSLSGSQVLSLRATHLPSSLQDCVQDIIMAAGHASVTSALSRLRLHLLIDRMAITGTHTHSCRDTLRSLTWQPAIARFVQVRPACVEDERLLVDVIAFLSAYFKQSHLASEDKDLRWILELLLKQETNSLLDLLLGEDSQTHTSTHAASQGETEELVELRAQINQRLQRELTGFINTLLHRLTHTTDRFCLALTGPFESQLAVRFLQCLRVSDAPRFYGLPSLERNLLGMVSLTAQPGWSSHCPTMEPQSLCTKYLSGLLEVISSFYVEWGGNSMSFMGKGVTKNAVICLLHLSHEMMAQNKDKDFISQWSLGQEAGSDDPSGSQLGLAWLIPLWVDRDPEVRFASLGVGSALSSVPSGCQSLSSSCQNISGGLWGTLLNILLDQQESTMVRREAVFILQNLLVMPMPATADQVTDSTWQSPCVHDESSGVCLVGLQALQALLYHCQFFQHTALMATACYRGRYTFDLQPSARDPGPQDSTTEDADDSLRLWRPPNRVPVNPSRASGSLSTSSTLIIPGGSRLQSPVPTSLNATAQDTPASRLMAQGQSDTDTIDSVLSQNSRLADPAPDPTCVIVTPDLLSALCGLLANLLAVLPEFTLSALTHSQLFQSLASLVDAAAIERCLGELKTNVLPGDQEDIKRQVLTLLKFLSSFSKFLKSCFILSSDLIGQMDFLKPLLANLFTVLTLDTKDLGDGTRGAVCVCWTDVLMLLATVVRRDGSAAYQSLSAALGRRWNTFTATLSVCVDQSFSDPPLHAAVLQFLCVVLSEEAKRRPLEVTTLNSDLQLTPLSEALNGVSGGQLCELLLESFEKRAFQDPVKKTTAKALMALLACSSTAQNHAAQAGLIDSCVEQMKLMHSHLHMESVRPGRGRRKESYMKEIKMSLEILRNSLYQNSQSKAVATDCRLAAVLHALWPWFLLDDAAMEAVLELLCVYTANCTTACSSLCCGLASGPRGPPGGSLMHCVMKLASGVAPDNSPVQQLAFSLLANLAINKDCKGVLHKSNFLQPFLSLPVPKPGSKTGAGGLLGLWLRLLLSVSFGEDGQLSVLRLTGALDLLADLAATQPQRHRHYSNGSRPITTTDNALLILHNVCFSSANKPKVLANDKAMRVLVSCLDSKEAEVRSIGASALWALLHNYQKAKTTLKCPSVRLRVHEAYKVAKKDAEKNPDIMNTYLLKCLENLIQLLNT
ncbi:rotatin isoform X1 [Oncorhynchus tshawytscha]|uniref:Rotatin N-terminal domain-containing protein n=1 Tax=Oncorhynchus tshawytscha TaxID=74940 RepID=A0A8C8GEN0_ONCTS|nr:rotatin isoform X1 [Oncorhynchus tshawytscha]